MDLFAITYDEPVKTNVRAHQCGTIILIVVNLMLILGSVTVLISPHWGEASFTDASKITHCFSYGPYEQCFTSTCVLKFNIKNTRKSMDVFDNHCIKLDIHEVETTEPKFGHVIHCTEIFVGIHIGMLLLSGLLYIIDIQKDFVLLKLSVGIFTLLAGMLLLTALPMFVLGSGDVYTTVTEIDPKKYRLETTVGLSILIGVGVGLLTVVVGVFNIVRSRRIFRKQTAQQKLGLAFGSAGL